MIIAEQLTKKFNQHTAVNNVSLSVSEGQIFGLLGPNAAGKTTTIRMLCGIIEPSHGHITIAGKHVDQAKQDFGYVSQYFGQYEELSVWENLRFYAHIYGIKDEARLSELVERYALERFKHQRAGSLSGGYQRRLALVCALVHDPKVLFLDEPTAGIDPTTRKLLWDDFYALSVEGKTLFVTTHYMEEAQRCHQLAFLSAGKIVAQGSPSSIKNALGEVTVYACELPYQPALRSHLLNTKDVLLINQFGDELRILTRSNLKQSALENSINEVTKTNVSLHVSKPNLEDVFIALTQDKNAQGPV